MASTQGQPRGDREWEHWPGRRAPDDGLRRRLRSLFAPTDESEAAVEELIAQHGRELEQRTRELAATISDLERREERTRELRAAIEDMLRRGSAELDERHAELNAFALDLARREDELAATDRELADRRQELGAVELRRAAAERREAALNDREAEFRKRETALHQAISELAERERQTESAEAQPRENAAAAAQLAAQQAELASRASELEAHEAELIARAELLERRASELEASVATHTPALRRPAAPVREHLVFLQADRYRLLEREGPPPEAGAHVELDGQHFVVVRVAISPLPGDSRPCVFVEPAFEPIAPDTST